MLCGMISSPTLPMQEYPYFTVSKFPINDKNFEYSKEQIWEIILSWKQTNKYLNFIVPLKRKSNPTAKHPDAVALIEDTYCKMCTTSQASEMFDRRIQHCLICISRAELELQLHTVQTQIIKGNSSIPSPEGGKPIIFPFQVQVSIPMLPGRHESRKWLNKQLCTSYCLNRISIRTIWRMILSFRVLFASNQVNKEVEPQPVSVPWEHISTIISTDQSKRRQLTFMEKTWPVS